MAFKFKLAAKVECKYTGFKGVATARSENLHAGKRYWVQSFAGAEGNNTNGQWLEEKSLRLHRPAKKKK